MRRKMLLAALVVLLLALFAYYCMAVRPVLDSVGS
jgi:hypothetical protein